MTSLRTRLLVGTIAGTTMAFAIGGVVVHKLARMRLEGDTDATLAQVLAFAVDHMRVETGRREDVSGRPIRPGANFLVSPTGRADTMFVCRMPDGVLVDASDELGEATAVIDLPGANTDSAVFGDFVLADGSPARGAALAFFPAPGREFGRANGEASSDSEPGNDAMLGTLPLRLIVLQSVAAREASLRHFAIVLALTWLLTCALGATSLWVTIRRGLAPLEDLRMRIADLDWRGMSQAVDVPGAPDELAPVIAQLESSRQRIVRAFRRERRFAGDAAHELRTPVSGIQAILEVALRRERTSEELRASARECLAIAGEMARAVEALLTLGKLSRGEVALELQNVDLAALSEECWKPIAHAARERGLALSVTGDREPIVANRDLLLRALANLIDNAVEHGDAPGVVEVSARRRDGMSVIEVSNPMATPPEGLAEHAFEPFWRGDTARTDAARHAGLGLALVSQIAELHGGEAAIRTDGERVVARITLPDA